jgi:hypothetical protein
MPELVTIYPTSMERRNPNKPLLRSDTISQYVKNRRTDQLAFVTL